jgi:hypothetical protein
LHVPGGWSVQPSTSSWGPHSEADARKCGQRCRWRHRPSPSGGERRYLRPQIPFSRTRTLSTSVPGLEKFIAPFVARQPGNCVRKQAFHPPVTRESFRLLSLRPGHQLTAAVRTDAIHAGSAARTEGAFVAADTRLAIKWQTGSALLARGPHFKGHVVRASPALGPPKSAAGALVRFFAGRIDASSVVFVALSSALRHPRRPLRISEAF